MATLGSVGAAQSSSVGPWCEVAVAASVIAVGATATAVYTITLPNAPVAPGQASVINPNLPIAATHLATGTGGGIQGGSNTLLPATVGVSTISLAGTPGTITLTYANAGAAYTLTTACRVLLVQNQGI
jgi:hypothetical protein